jgi:hypothetical protein
VDGDIGQTREFLHSDRRNDWAIEVVSAGDLLLLRALLQEPTRQAVACRLGCSTRHLRRRLHSLLARIDVSTSHAAVAKAAWRGWLEEEDLGPVRSASRHEA